MQSSNKTFTIEVKGEGITKVTTEIGKLSDSLEKLQSNISKSNMSLSLGGVFGNCDQLSKLFEDFTSKIEKLVLALNKEVPKPEEKPQSESPKEGNGERDEKKVDKYAAKGEEVADYLEKLKELLKAKNAAIEEGLEPSKAYYKLIGEVIKNGGAKKAAEATPDGNGAKDKDGKKEEAKPDPNALGGNFGLDKLTKIPEDKSLNIAEVTKSNGVTDVEETRKRIDGVIAALDDYDTKLAVSKKLSEDFFNGLRETNADDKDMLDAIQMAQDDYNKVYDTKLAESVKKRKEAIKVTNEMQWGSMEETTDFIQDIETKYKKYLTDSFDGLNKLFTANKELYTAEADKIKETITEVNTKLTESTNKRKSLIEEEKKATGGRAVVLQEQIAREMAANDELSKQKEELSKKEKDLRDKAKKEDARSKRANIVKQMVTATADVAKGVTAELSKGLIGIPTAAIIAAQGAIQILTLKKQLDKVNLEDGGLLRGKRHSQGGMRIEGTNIEVEGDEFVVNRDSTRKNLGLIDYINRNRRELTPDDISSYYRRQSKGAESSARPTMKQIYEDGGMLTNLDMVEGSNMRQVNNKILEAIENINFHPVVSVVEITDMQQSITSLKNTAGA